MGSNPTPTAEERLLTRRIGWGPFACPSHGTYHRSPSVSGLAGTGDLDGLGRLPVMYETAGVGFSS